MRTYIKYGLITMLCWNALLTVATIISSNIKKVPISHFFDDGTNGVVMIFLLILWSLIWFGIGYHARKSFLKKKQLYRNEYPNLEKNLFNKAFRSFYFSKHAKMLSIVFATAIPWYVIGYIRTPLEAKDLIVIGPLMLLSILSFWLSKFLSN